MKPTLSILALLAVITMVIRTAPHAEAATPLVVATHRAYSPQFATEEVTFNLGRVQRDPGGAIGWRQLASAYLAAGREKDSAELAKKAEKAALKSLALRQGRNAAAAVILSEALLEQHRFSEALVACQKSLVIEPENDFAERTLADIYFEIGRYQDADKLLGKHPEWNNDPSGLTLVARQFELTGHPAEAIVTVRRGVELAESRYDFPATTVSWFHVKYGDILARNGQLSSADQQYQIALQQNSGSWKALAGIARLKAMQGDPRGVIAFGEKLNAIAPMTNVVGLMEDAARSLNDTTASEKYAAQVLTMNQSTIDAGTSPINELDQNRTHTHDRMFSVYLADHDKMLKLAQHAATHDLASRKDIYAYDTYAWATFKLGMNEQSVSNTANAHDLILESKQSIDKALALGTKDATILNHASSIELALGHRDISNRYHELARTINAYAPAH